MGVYSAGLYACFVLTVFYIRVTNAVLDITMQAKLNHDVQLPCKLPDGYTGVRNVRWFNKKDGWLSDGNTVYKHQTQLSIVKPAPDEWNLFIRKVTLSFEDDYTCQTAAGTLLSKVKLQIETSPKIVDIESSPIRVSFAEYEVAVLTCAATGTPEPEITWYRGLSETAIGITGSILKIPEATRYATDEYICRARNSNGEAERRIHVTINFAPEVAVMEPEVYAAGGEIAVMSCAVTASVLYDAYWTRGTGLSKSRINTDWKYEVKVEESGDNIPIRFLTLVIRKSIVSTTDYGLYTCFGIAENHVAQGTVELKERKQKPIKMKGR